MIKSKNAYQKFLKYEFLLHVFIWNSVLFYPYIKYLGREGGYSLTFAHELNSLAFKMMISYFLYFWYFPRKRQLKYLLLVILALITTAALYEFTDRYFHLNMDPNHFWKHFVANTLTYVSFGIVFFAIYSVKDLYRKQARIDTLSQEKNEAELKALKAQMNPHFLFNTLNTIYANALKKDDKTPDLILKLSDSFRYLLHEGQKEFVTIEQEILHIEDYIKLQQERLSRKVVVDFSSELDAKIQLIAPLLLIVFVENAFKYTSVLKGDEHPIKIKISLKKGELLFQCQNPFDEKAQTELDTTWKESGVGIQSTQKRLDLLYPEKHQLMIKKEKNIFTVRLKIQL